MTTLEILLIVLLIAVVAAMLLMSRKPKTQVSELAIADRLQAMQASVADSLGKVSKDAADHRAALTEAQQKQELAMADRLAKLEKGVQNTVALAQKEVATSKQAMDKNALDLNKFMANLGVTIEKLATQQQAASKFSEDLKFLLEGPKARGTFGETILEEMLTRTLPEGIWHRQYAIDGREAVDAAIELKGTIYPIDSKFPKEDYQRYLRAATPEERSKAWKGYESAIKTQIDSISRKYVKPESGTANFALMFIPSEGIYYETIADKNHLGEPNALMEYAYEQRVVPVGPNTFFAFLQIIVKALEGQKLVDNARSIQENLAKIQSSFDKFYAKYEDTGKAIAKAQDAYRLGDGHIQRFKERLDGVVESQLPMSIEEPALLPPLPPNVIDVKPMSSARPAPLPPAPPAPAPTPTIPSTPAARVRGPKAFKVEE